MKKVSGSKSIKYDKVCECHKKWANPIKRLIDGINQIWILAKPITVGQIFIRREILLVFLGILSSDLYKQ